MKMPLAITPFLSYQFQKMKIISCLGTANPVTTVTGAFKSALYYPQCVSDSVKATAGRGVSFNSLAL